MTAPLACIHTVYMTVSSVLRKPLGVRATPAQHKVLTQAAARANRSVSSFVLTAALKAASAEAPKPRRSLEDVRAIVEAARKEIRKHNPTKRDLSEELIAERRAEAARDQR